MSIILSLVISGDHIQKTLPPASEACRVSCCLAPYLVVKIFGGLVKAWAVAVLDVRKASWPLVLLANSATITVVCCSDCGTFRVGAPWGKQSAIVRAVVALVSNHHRDHWEPLCWAGPFVGAISILICFPPMSSCGHPDDPSHGIHRRPHRSPLMTRFLSVFHSEEPPPHPSAKRCTNGLPKDWGWNPASFGWFLRFLKTISFLFQEGNCWTTRGTYSAMMLLLGADFIFPKTIVNQIQWLDIPKSGQKMNSKYSKSSFWLILKIRLSPGHLNDFSLLHQASSQQRGSHHLNASAWRRNNDETPGRTRKRSKWDRRSGHCQESRHWNNFKVSISRKT